MARSLATELIDTLGFYDDPHIFGFINRHMMLIGGEALELKNQLIALRDLPVTEAVGKALSEENRLSCRGADPSVGG